MLNLEEEKELRTIELAEKLAPLSDEDATRREELRGKMVGDVGLRERMGVAFGAGMSNLYEGIGQAYLQATDPQAAREFTAEANARREAYRRLEDKYPWTTIPASIVGQAAAAPVGGFGPSMATRLMTGAGLGAGIGGLIEFQPGGGGLAERLRGAAFGGMGGVLGELLSPAARIVRGWFPQRGGLATTPQPSPMDPVQLAPELEMPQPGPQPRTEYWDADFGIPYTRGQAMQDVPQMQLEERIRRGAGGFSEEASQEMQELLNYQRQRIDEAFMGVGQQTAAAPPGTAMVPYGAVPVSRTTLAGEAQAGSRFEEALTDRANALWDDIDAAFERSRGTPAYVPVEDANAIVADLRGSLAPEDLLTPELNPETHAVLGSLESFLLQAPDNADAMTVSGLHTMRRFITERMKNAAPGDMRNLRNLRGRLDAAMTDLVDQGRLIGDEQAIASLREGINLRADYGRIYGQRTELRRSGRRVQDPAGKVIEDIVEGRMSGQDVANAIFGSKTFGNRNTTEILRRAETAAGRDSREYAALRNIALMRLRNNTLQAGTESISPQKFLTQWNQIRNRQPELLAQLFEPADVARMNAFANAVELARPHPDVINSSNTAHMLESMLLKQSGGRLPQIMAGIATGATGGAGTTAPMDLGISGGLAGGTLGALAGIAGENWMGPSLNRAVSNIFARRAYERPTRGFPGGAATGAAAAGELEDQVYQ